MVSLVYIDYLAFSLCTISISSVHSFRPLGWPEWQEWGIGRCLVSVEPLIWRPHLALVQNVRLWDCDKMDGKWS